MERRLPSRVRIVEVGPRDGLQNEPEVVPTEDKVAFIQDLADAGHTQIEVAAFVHPRWVLQMADAGEVLRRLPPRSEVKYSALVPNLKGLERAQEAGLRRIAVFTAASNTFNRKNINATIDETLATIRETAAAALKAGMTVRGYISTCWVCPFEGDVPRETVRYVSEALLEAGVDEISLGDTIGAAAPTDVYALLEYLLEFVPRERLALHFHDTYGTALANVAAGLDVGIETFDASAGGLGGCPYAPGASGNLATEDLVYMLDRMGVPCGVDLHRLAEASFRMEKVLGRRMPGKQLQRLRSTKVAPA